MNKDILEYLNTNAEKINRLAKDETVVKHNLTNNMHTWIKGYTDEMKYANEDRKRTLEREIENISQDIIDTEEKVTKEYDSKKKTVLSDSVHKIEEFANELFDDVVCKINKGKNNLDVLKEEINKNSMNGNFDDVIILAAQAKKSEVALLELNTLKNSITSIINRITETLDNMDSILFSDAKKEYDSYIEDISKLSTDFDFDFDFIPEENEKQNIEEILYYLEKAQDVNGDISKRKEALDYACSLVNKLKDESLKETLLADLASAYDAIKKDSDSIVDPNYEFAKRLVEKAEETEKAKDFIAAYKSLKNVSENKGKLAKRLSNLTKINEDKFIILLEDLKEQQAESKKLDKDKLLELEDRYKYVSDDFAEKNQSSLENLIIYNNNIMQDEEKEKYQIKKDNFFTMVGKVFTFVKGSKIAAKFNLGRLSKIKSMVVDAEDEDKKQYLEEQYLKISNKLASNSIVGGLKLFVAQKRLEKLKPKLYSGENLTKRQTKKIQKSIKTIDKKLNKALAKKTDIDVEEQNKEYIISVVDQYLYLIATGENYKDTIDCLSEYLDKVKDKLTEAELQAIEEQMYMIEDYRSANDNAIYEIKSNIVDGNVTTELDDVVKYYDSEECKIGFRQTPVYIKR